MSRQAVLKYLNDWLRHHALDTDQKLAAFVRETATRQKPDQAG